MTWAQRESLRRLAFALRPLIDRGLDGVQIAAELHGMCMGWRPANPAAYIQVALARDAQREGQLATRCPAQPTWPSGPTEPVAEWGRALEEMRRLEEEEELAVVAEVGEGQLMDAELLDPADVATLRGAAESDIGIVLAALSVSEVYAVTLYGPDLVRRAEGSRSSTMVLNSTFQPT
ncbi:hypothetical protein [Streptomyces cucumeris]|uniref:hypothetical protein n=1 Tax=Streptomyces cucumeris TaxID=2962890 RepID=UPI0020C89F42|nr:hypothetical protein [Streptomyces sp. NEAU-Y11]MCP9213288.1 hypothetical protein [Streptomyces sp. NEAU-Y11]